MKRLRRWLILIAAVGIGVGGARYYRDPLSDFLSDMLERGRLVSYIRTETGVPRSQLDVWRGAGLPGASLHLFDKSDCDPIPVHFA